LPNPSCKSTFLTRKLDISDPASVEKLATEVKKAHPDGIDAIINNAGVNLNPEGYSEETIKNTLKINYYGTKSVSQMDREVADELRCAITSFLSSRKAAGS